VKRLALGLENRVTGRRYLQGLPRRLRGERGTPMRSLHQVACVLLVVGTTCTLSCGNEGAGGLSDGAVSPSSASGRRSSGSLAGTGSLASEHSTIAGSGGGPGGMPADQLGAAAGGDAAAPAPADDTVTEPAFSITLSTSGCLALLIPNSSG